MEGHLKIRTGPDGLHLFSRRTGINILVDELSVPRDQWSIEPVKWLSDGPSPNYGNLLEVEEIDGVVGPWVLIQGFIEETSPSDDRRVFSFLRGLIVERMRSEECISRFNAIEYPGNSAIPEPWSDHYTYAGEIPWSHYFGMDLRNSDGTARQNISEAFEVHDGTAWVSGVPVEILAHNFAWESYHSELNRAGNAYVLAPALCEMLCLINHRGEWDLYDYVGRQATVCREFKGEGDTFDSQLLYLRADLMANYLPSDRELLWFVWGERTFHHRDFESYRDCFSGHSNIHRSSARWAHPSAAS